MNLKNALIKQCVSWLKPSPPQTRSERKFLIVSTTGLGDTLWGTPGIRALRESYPNSPIVVLTSPIGREILLHNQNVDELIVVKDPVLLSLFPLYFDLKRKQITDVLLFHTSQRPILPLMALIGAERVIGTGGINKGLDFLLTDLLENRPVHEIERRLDIVQKAGAHGVDFSRMELPVSGEDDKQAEEFLSQCKLSPSIPLISMHPGAKDLFKQWPPSHFIALGNRLVKELGCQIFLTGNPSERELVAEISEKIPGAIPVTHLKLRPFAAFLKRMGLMITNDTGPMHVAFAVETPTVALFTPTDPKLCGPYFIPKGRVIARKRTCTPCLRKKCREPFCLLQIGPEEVYEAVVQTFKFSH